MTSSADPPVAPKWRGINHLALVTPDMDTTVRFYAGVLGMPLVMTLMAGPMRHYFFEMSPQNTVAFFEIPDAETFEKGSGSPAPYPVQLDHDVMKSVYFTDPNGIALEASYWVVDGTGRDYDPSDESRFLDPDPVPAVAELAAQGVTTMPQTKLV